MTKKIMFSDRFGLTEAVLQGRKTMTRRIAYDGEIKDINTGYITEGVFAGRLALCDGCMIVAKSKYKLGEVVAVAQSYKDLGYTKKWVEQHISPNPNANWNDPFEKKYPGWNNKMFTHSELEKVRKIEITNIKVERLQDISYEDCVKEGLRDYIIGFGFDGWVNEKNELKHSPNPRIAFAALINKVSGKGTWESNPWNFAYTFELIK